MSRKTLNLTDTLHEYLLSTSLREPPVLERLREETAQDPKANMQIAPEQGQLLNLLVRLMGARRTIEIGVYTGYSALWTALALPSDGQLVACDIDEQWTTMARRYWEEAGVSHKMVLRLAPASQTLDMLLAEGEAGQFDFAFIDADKESYELYYERCLELLRPGGLIVADNVLWNGRVVDPDSQDEDTRAIRAFNDKLHGDERVAISMIPIADGVTLAFKLPR